MTNKTFLFAVGTVAVIWLLYRNKKSKQQPEPMYQPAVDPSRYEQNNETIFQGSPVSQPEGETFREDVKFRMEELAQSYDAPPSDSIFHRIGIM